MPFIPAPEIVVAAAVAGSIQMQEVGFSTTLLFSLFQVLAVLVAQTVKAGVLNHFNIT